MATQERLELKYVDVADRPTGGARRRWWTPGCRSQCSGPTEELHEPMMHLLKTEVETIDAKPVGWFSNPLGDART